MPYLTNAQRREVFQKMRVYCSSQSRSHFEIKEKLYGFGLWRKDVESILAELIEHNSVNEAKFAQAFVERQKDRAVWGRNKIKSSLINKRVSPYNIERAMGAIDETAYREVLEEQALEKWQSVKGIGANVFVKMRKTGQFLLQRGYEPKLVWEVLTLLRNHKL